MLTAAGFDPTRASDPVYLARWTYRKRVRYNRTMWELRTVAERLTLYEEVTRQLFCQHRRAAAFTIRVLQASFGATPCHPWLDPLGGDVDGETPSWHDAVRIMER